MRKRFLVCIPLIALLSVPAQAQNLADALKACGKVQHSLKRLVCFDGIVRDLNRYSGKEDILKIPANVENRKSDRPVVIIPKGQSAQEQGTADFGLEHKKMTDKAQQSIVAKIASVKKDQAGKLTFTFTNGQVWKQIGTEKFAIKSGESVLVERGGMNSFLMGKEGMKKRIRVKRVK